ncbi:MAG: amidohydrolase family protein, partial [Candidatus Latescibacteria bacterium]|nr:amidohydrolase family protein [Candidatus Latescibacterota bacterium]
MPECSFFDCHCMIGRRTEHEPGEIWRVDQLLTDMAYFGIARTLVFHALAKEYAPSVGNERLLEEIEGRESLYGCWVALPPHTGEMEKPEAFVQAMIRAGVGAVRVFPKLHAFSLDEWCCGPLWKELEARRVPVLIDKDQVEWSEVWKLCKAHPNLPVILTGVGYREDRNIYPLFEACDQLYVEISWYGVHLGIEAICRRFGAGRLLFGTRMPFFTPGTALTAVRYAQISSEEKRRIAGETLRRLLEDVIQ